jgi:hypothetical protein
MGERQAPLAGEIVKGRSGSGRAGEQAHGGNAREYKEVAKSAHGASLEEDGPR